MIRQDRLKLLDDDILNILENGDDSDIEEFANDDDLGNNYCHEDLKLLEGNLYFILNYVTFYYIL